MKAASWRTISPVDTPRIRITVNGKPALTVEQAAERKGVGPSTMRAELARYADQIQPAAELDGRKKLYLLKDIDAFWAARPGRGSPRKKQ